jgi:hypothetical protein
MDQGFERHMEAASGMEALAHEGGNEETAIKKRYGLIWYTGLQNPLAEVA